MPSPIAFNRSLATPSMFSKNKKSNVDFSSAASYLAAVSEMDARQRSSSASLSPSTHSGSPTPALSLSSTLTSSTEDTPAAKDCYEPDVLLYDTNEDGLSLPLTPPTSEQVFTTVHSEFGHCANESFRYESRAHPGDHYSPVEPEPPYRILLTTYISYILLICIGHLRDFFGKRFRSANYRHLKKRDVRVFTRSQF